MFRPIFTEKFSVCEYMYEWEWGEYMRWFWGPWDVFTYHEIISATYNIAEAVLVLESKNSFCFIGFQGISTLNWFENRWADDTVYECNFSKGWKACYPSILLNIRKFNNINTFHCTFFKMKILLGYKPKGLVREVGQ